MLNYRGRSETQKHNRPSTYSVTAPEQVYMWDITYLNGPHKRMFYYLYLFSDIYDKSIVGWEVYEVAKVEHPERWNGRTNHNGSLPDTVNLNPDKMSESMKNVSEMSKLLYVSFAVEQIARFGLCNIRDIFAKI